MTDGTTRRHNEGEVLLRCSPPEAVDTGGEGPDRRRDVSVGDQRIARRSPARHPRQSDFHLASVDEPVSTDSCGSGRGSGTGVRVPSAGGASP